MVKDGPGTIIQMITRQSEMPTRFTGTGYGLIDMVTALS